ncbi:MAG: hypothetical protein DRP11_00100 [Candidatus Aenigmatarchaeota archaeon]|nr:MAG: hypothetical protein DRP11_00100 [Candidatus Aenigmarchaeota archaeon]
MHLIVVAEGAKIWIEKFINDLSAMWLYPKERDEKVQLAVREVKLLDLVFPESCKDQVLAALGLENPEDNKEIKRFHTVISWLRRFLKLKPVKCNVPPSHEIYKPFVRVIPVGIKEDSYVKGLEQL